MRKIELSDAVQIDEERIKIIFELFGHSDTNDIIFPLSPIRLIEIGDHVLTTLENVDKSDNVRIAVIEVWLVLDYLVRLLLRIGLDLERFTDEEFDILPQGFRDCLEILKKFIKNQQNKLPNPASQFFYIPQEFQSIIQQDEDFRSKLLNYESIYYQKIGLASNVIFNPHDSSYANVQKYWLARCSQLSQSWFDKAEKLNRVRNLASHSHNLDSIYKEVGISGPKRDIKFKAYCQTTIKELLKVF